MQEKSQFLSSLSVVLLTGIFVAANGCRSGLVDVVSGALVKVSLQSAEPLAPLLCFALLDGTGALANPV